MKKIRGSGTFFDHYSGKYGGKLLFRSNLKQQDSTLLNFKDPFLKEIIQYWTKCNYKDDNLDFASTCIWYNSHIRIENRPFFWRSWLSAGIKGIRDLLDNDQNFLSYNAFIDKNSIKTNYLEYHKVIMICCSTLQESTLYSLSWPNSKGSSWYRSVLHQSFQENLRLSNKRKSFYTIKKSGKVVGRERHTF